MPSADAIAAVKASSSSARMDSGRAAHRDVDILDPEFFRERCFIEPDLRHLLRHPQIHDRRHALGPELAKRLFRRLAADEHVVAHAHELGLEQARRTERHRVRHGAGLVLADDALRGGGRVTETASAAAAREQEGEEQFMVPSEIQLIFTRRRNC